MRYCVGITMRRDWGEDEETRGLDRRLVRRVLSYFRPYWRAGALALGCIVAGALLGLAPALVFRALIDYLGGADPAFGHLALLVGAGIAAAVAGGLIGLGQSYLEERISQGGSSSTCASRSSIGSCTSRSASTPATVRAR